MEGIEVQGFVDVLVFPFAGLTAGGRAVVTRVVQGVDLAILASGDKWVLLDWIQEF